MLIRKFPRLCWNRYNKPPGWKFCLLGRRKKAGEEKQGARLPNGVTVEFVSNCVVVSDVFSLSNAEFITYLSLYIVVERPQVKVSGSQK
ncbi:hypothetical protein CDAR_123691 [Caerostris darwini]|uniref:Uncharacterized protein n=1 Tax=Caerostris darwini TaxID=1538125 RepID=A0AAV4WUS0_9ARAC|nr:hypothetical protein CDAR_123691 [Caerostris darwini]